jgi:tetraacyldisaccharide 4'-kinase
MSIADRVWYGKSGALSCLVHLPLMPFSALFAAVSGARRFCYARGILKSSAPGVPVLVVGGITVGGSGKTPLCAALLKHLADAGWHPGLISRGYRGRAPSYPYEVHEDSDPAQTGDEPLLIKRELGDRAVVMVDPDRARGAFALAEAGCGVIVSDDGLQHYSLERDAEIIVVDSVRKFGNGHLLPAGPLREGRWRLRSAAAVVYNGAGAVPIGGYVMTLAPKPPRALNGKGGTLQHGTSVLALAGIGNPGRFYATLRDMGLKVAGTIPVPDHGVASEDKLRRECARMSVVMTAKDAVKYEKSGLDNLFAVDVEARLSDSFYEAVDAALATAEGVAVRRGTRMASRQ